MAHVVFTAINYAPEPSGNAPYTTALAESLVEAGHRVTVITGFPHYPAWKVPSGYTMRLRASETINGVEVKRRRHYVPGRQSVVGRGLYEATFLLHGLATRLDRPDVVVAVVPSLSGAAIARFLAAKYRVPYAVLVQDTMGRAAAQSGIAAGGRVTAAITNAERWSLARATSVAVVSTSFIPYLRSLGVPEERLVHVPNWSLDRQPDVDAATTRARLGWDGQVIVLHAGNMGLKQGLEQVLAAAELAATSDSSVRFVLLGDGNQRPQLQHAAAGLRNVSFLPSQGDAEYAAALSAADVLLLSERPTVTDMSLPSKLTSYCAAGRPIVAAVRPGGATATEVTNTGAGVVVSAGDPAALLAAVESIVCDPALATRLSNAGLARASSSLAAPAALERARTFVELAMARRPRKKEAA